MLTLESSRPLDEEERAFLQHRVSVYGIVIGSLYLAYLVYRILHATVLGHFALLMDNGSSWWHLAGGLCFLAAGLVSRRGKLSAGAIRRVETTGLLAGSACFLKMGMFIPLFVKPEFILFTVLTMALTGRAIFVPSSARRTLMLALFVGCFFIFGTYELYLKIDPKNWVQHDPSFAGVTPHQMAVNMAVVMTSWWFTTSFVTTAASHVIYGLRREVRDAKQLGQYHLDAKIGEGGMGEVYKASHALLRRPTAVKLLKTEFAKESNQKLFEKEVQQTARLSHPNIVTIFDYGHTAAGVFYYAMEYLNGVTLRTLVESDGPQPPARVLSILRQVADALIHAHGEGLIHRDIKPANIMLTLPHFHGGAEELAQLLDFGLVRETTDDGTIDLSQTNTVSGTPQFMAPEAIKSPGSVDARSDLYAVGCVAYYLITGTHVFTGGSVVEVCSHHLHTAPEALSDRLGEPVASDLEKLILQLLAKDPEERPESALAFRQQLKNIEVEGSWSADAALAWWTSAPVKSEEEAAVSLSKKELQPAPIEPTLTIHRTSS